MLELKAGDCGTFVNASMYGSYTTSCTVLDVNDTMVHIKYFDSFIQEWDERWIHKEDYTASPKEQKEFWLVKFGDGTYLANGASTSPTLYRSKGKAKARMPHNPKYKGGARVVKWTYTEEDCD